jgi:hypothetical protein
MCVSEGAPANGFLVDNLDNVTQELNATGGKLKSEIKEILFTGISGDRIWLI